MQVFHRYPRIIALAAGPAALLAAFGGNVALAHAQTSGSDDSGTVVAPPYDPQPPLPGDTNHDGSIDWSQVVAPSHADSGSSPMDFGNVPFDPTTPLPSDTNQDGSIDWSQITPPSPTDPEDDPGSSPLTFGNVPFDPTAPLPSDTNQDGSIDWSQVVVPIPVDQGD